MIFDKEASSFSGGVSFKDYELAITNPITVTIGPSIVTINGSAHFEDEYLNLDLALIDASPFLINNFWTDSLSGGLATGSMELMGSFDTLGLSADLIINGLQYRNISLSAFEF